MEEIVRSLSHLSLSSEPKKELRHLKTALLGLDARDTTVLPRDCNLSALFDSLNTSDDEQIELTVQVMSELLPCVREAAGRSALDAGVYEALGRLREDLLRAFLHPNESVRRLMLKQALQRVATEGGVADLTQDTEMLHAVLKSMGDESLGVVKLAICVVIKICRAPAGLQTVFAPPALAVLKEIVAKKDSRRFNVYELMVQISLLGPPALAATLTSSLLDHLLSEVTTGDSLTQLAALQLLTPLAQSPWGRTYLDEQGVTERLMYLLSLAKSDPVARLLTHGLLEFLGNLGQHRPRHTLEQHGAAVLMVLQLAAGTLQLDGDSSLQAAALKTLACIGWSAEGTLALSKCKHEMDQVLEALGTEAMRGTSDMKVLALEVLTELFQLAPQETREEVVVALELWWANTLSLGEVFKLARLPFPDQHCAALRLLTVLARLPWGQRLLCAEPGLVEYILDRKTESDKEGMEVKWKLAETLFKSASSSTFPEDDLCRLEKYYRQGPFYVEAQMEVALEGQD